MELSRVRKKFRIPVVEVGDKIVARSGILKFRSSQI